MLFLVDSVYYKGYEYMTETAEAAYGLLIGHRLWLWLIVHWLQTVPHVFFHTALLNQ